MSWDWGSIVSGVTSTLRAVEAQIDTVVGIPPNAPLIAPTAEAAPSTASMPSVRAASSNAASAVHKPDVVLAQSKTAPDLRWAASASGSKSAPRSAPAPEIDARQLEEILSSDEPAAPAASQPPTATAPDSDVDWISVFDLGDAKTASNQIDAPAKPAPLEEATADEQPAAASTSDIDADATPSLLVEPQPVQAELGAESASPLAPSPSLPSAESIVASPTLSSPALHSPPRPSSPPLLLLSSSDTSDSSSPETSSSDASPSLSSSAATPSSSLETLSSTMDIPLTSDRTSEILAPLDILPPTPSIPTPTPTSTPTIPTPTPTSTPTIPTPTPTTSTSTPTTPRISSSLSLTVESSPSRPTLTASSDDGRASSHEEVETVRQQFNQRIAELEKKLLGVTQERELWKNEAKNRSVYAQLESLNETNRLLREEGVALSKKQLQYETTMKNLRKKEKEQEAELAKLRQQVSGLEEAAKSRDAEIARLQETEKRQKSEALELRRMLDSSEASLKEARLSRDHSAAENLVLHQSLQDAQRELSALSESRSSNQIQSEKRWREAEAALKREHERDVDELKKHYEGLTATLARQADDLREQVVHEERKTSRIEEQLRAEIRLLQERLQQATSENAELYTTLSAASQPYLQQISSLQAAVQLSQRALDSQEATSRREIEALRDRCAQLTGQLRGAEDEAGDARAEAARLRRDVAEREADVKRLQAAEQAAVRQAGELEQLGEALKKKLADETQRAERAADETERARLALLAELNAAKAQSEALKSQLASLRRAPSSGGDSSSLVAKAVEAGDGVAAAGMQKTFELLRQREAETLALLNQLEVAQDVRSRLENTIVELNERQEHMQQQVDAAARLAKQHKRLTIRHQTALELIGQKNERLAELEADLAEFKELYRTQVTELLKTIEALK